MTVKGITNNNILTGLIPNMTMIYTRYIGPKILGLEVNDNVSKPNIIGTYHKERFIRKRIFCHIFHISGGWREGHIST
jgi:hypothetical protein